MCGSGQLSVLYLDRVDLLGLGREELGEHAAAVIGLAEDQVHVLPPSGHADVVQVLSS